MEAGNSEAKTQPLTGVRVIEAASFIAGVATMSYGSNYRHNRRRYGQHWTLAPQAAPGMLGASGSLRF